jgi:hypothetical protein
VITEVIRVSMNVAELGILLGLAFALGVLVGLWVSR